MDAAIAAALIGVGGVALGVGLSTGVEVLTRGKVGREQAEQARHARELVAAENLDEGLIRVQETVETSARETLRYSYVEPSEAWGKTWIAYSPRIRREELRERCFAVGTLLTSLALDDPVAERIPRRMVWQAIANARATLGRFMRGDKLPANAFPTSEELVRLLGEGEASTDVAGTLRAWIDSHPKPDFHDDPTPPDC